MGKNWFSYYFAVQPTNLKLFEENGLSASMLMSFAYFNKRVFKEREDLHSIIRRWKTKGHKFMLDSGAFTNFRKPGTVAIEPYVEYLQSFCSCWDEYITLDDLASRKNTLNNFNTLKSKGLNPLFVDHLKFTDEDAVNRLWKSEIKICVSGWGTISGEGTGAKEDSKAGNLQKLFNRGELAKTVQTKMHILAVSSLAKFLPIVAVVNSVDSAAWARAPGYGEVFVCVENRIGGLNIPGYKRHALPWYRGTTKKPMTPEIKAEWEKHCAKKWATTSKSAIAQLFCIVQIQKYLRLLNALVPQNISDAVKREKEARKMAGVKKTFFIDDFSDAWDGSVEGLSEARSAEPLILTKTITSIDDLKFTSDLNLIELHSRIHKNWNAVTPVIKSEAIKSHGVVHIEMVRRTLEIPGMDASDYEIIRKQVITKQVPQGSASIEDKRKAQIVRAREYGIEPLEGKGERLSFPAGYPTSLNDYGDPVNLMYPLQPDGRARNARARFKQFAQNYDRENSKKIVHTRIVKRLLNIGATPNFNPDDNLDKLLPQNIKDKLKKREGVEKTVKLCPIDKANDQQIAFGVVLEPDEVDTQNDTIKPEEIEQAAHIWLAKYQDRGIMHSQIANGKIEIYESYVAPTELNINGQKIKKGTWLLMYHVLDKELWGKIKSGQLTGFSMGGFARRNPI